LDDYRDAYNRMDAEGVKRVFPNKDLRSLRFEFSQAKSIKYTLPTDKLEYKDLNLEQGTATVEVELKTKIDQKAGPPTGSEGVATFILRRDGIDAERWTIMLFRSNAK